MRSRLLAFILPAAFAAVPASGADEPVAGRLSQLKAAYGFEGELTKETARGLLIFDSNLRQLEGLGRLRINAYKDKNQQEPAAFPAMDTLSANTYASVVRGMEAELTSKIEGLRSCARDQLREGRPPACGEEGGRALGPGSIAVGKGAVASNGGMADGAGSAACGWGARAVGRAVAVGDKAYAQGEGADLYAAVGPFASARPEKKLRRHVLVRDVEAAVARSCGAFAEEILKRLGPPPPPDKTASANR